MNDTPAITIEAMSVPPGKDRPWWRVRWPLLAVLGALLLMWVALSFNHSRVQHWVAKDLPLNDKAIIRLAGESE